MMKQTETMTGEDGETPQEGGGTTTGEGVIGTMTGGSSDITMTTDDTGGAAAQQGACADTGEACHHTLCLTTIGMEDAAETEMTA